MMAFAALLGLNSCAATTNTEVSNQSNRGSKRLVSSRTFELDGKRFKEERQILSDVPVETELRVTQIN